MKRLIVVMMMMIAFVVPSIAEVVEVVKEVEPNFWLDLITENVELISVLALWLVSRLVPTKWKDPVLTVVTWLISLIPDKKAGGGKH